MAQFIAQQVSIQLCAALRPVVARLKKLDAELADQLRRASSHVPLHLAEGTGRRGKDQTHLYRIAASSASEARVAVELGVALGYFDGLDLTAAEALFDRQAALLYRLLHPRRA